MNMIFRKEFTNLVDDSVGLVAATYEGSNRKLDKVNLFYDTMEVLASSIESDKMHPDRMVDVMKATDKYVDEMKK